MSGTPYLVGSFSAASGGSLTPQFTITNSVATGDAILVGVLCTSGTVTAVGDSQANGYTLVTSETLNSGCQLFVFAAYGAVALTGGTDIIQATYSTNASVVGIIAVGDNGVQTSSDITVAAAGTSTTASAGTGTLGSSEEHVIAFIADLAAGGVPTLGGGLTALTHVEGGTTAFITAGYEVVSSNASVTPSGTITSTTWAICVVTSKVLPVTVSTNLADGVQGEAYSQTLEATGGVGADAFLVQSGSLPPSLNLNTVNANGYFPSGSGTGWFGFNATFSVTGSPPAGAPYPFAGVCAVTGVNGNAFETDSGSSTNSAIPVTGGQPYLLGAWVYSSHTTAYIGNTWQNPSGTNLTTSTTTITIPANTWTFITTIQTANASATFTTPFVSTDNGFTIYFQAVQLASFGATNRISGTPTGNGSFPITVQAFDVNGVSGTSAQTIVIAPNVVSGAPPQALPNNLLSAADSDFEVPGFTWAAATNANAPARTSQIALTGSWSLSWSSAADGDTSIQSGLIPGIKPNSPYILSSFLMPSNPRGLLIGVNWYTAGGSQIGTTVNIPAAVPGAPLAWQPVPGTATSPATAAQARVVVTAQATNKGEMQHLELPYIAQASEQVLVDWVNPPFAPAGQAGAFFMDVSSFVRMDQGITTKRGRTDAVSETQPGSATFRLQNDNGLFTRFNSPTLITAHGGTITLQRRCQINFADELGNWHTRFDGPVSAIDYDYENTGNTSDANITLADVLAYLNRRDALKGWTRERIRVNGPMLHWALNDTGTTGGAGIATETSGNNGPPMRLLNSDKTGTATITWQTVNGGVETLADAGNQPLPGFTEGDGSEFWNPGSNQPSSPIRGLDSGKAGPFASPSPSPYFVPKLTAASTAGTFTSNTGYMLQAQFPSTPLNPGIVGNDFAIECWYTMDPGISANKATNNGPYVALSFGSSRKQSCYVFGIFYAAGPLVQFGAYRYPQAPAFLNVNGLGGGFIGGFTPVPPTPSGGTQITVNPDTVQLPHHIVVNIDADTPGNPVAHVYLDGVSVTDISMKADDVIDTICVGGAYGGTGAFWGGVQLVSVYPFQLSQSQIVKDCQTGQYGMWETTTDDAIAEISAYSGLPAFWNQVTGAHNGLSLTEYQDITNQNPLTAMQLYEQAEKGLLFVNSSGQLTFHTRDWRMGYPGPDLLLPPNTFDAAMQSGIVDQFMQNEAGVATQVLQTGSGAVNPASRAAYGPYAVNPPSTPQQLPLITWSRAAAQLGLPAFNYSTDPNLDDLAAWNANSFGDPFFVPGLLTVDLLTLDPTTGLAPSNFYALDIDNVIAPSGAVPASFPNQSLAQEWFIEGIQETRSLTVRTIAFYCSPTTVQRAWRPGDATYGVLGSTSRIGIAQNDSPFLPADGKDVTHDAGRPYWPPNFQPGGGWSDVGAGTPLANNYFIVSTAAAQAIGNGDKFTVSPPDGNIYTVTSQGAPFAGFVNVFFTPNAPSVLSASFTMTQLIGMNNPAQNGHGFIGASDIRGLADNLSLMLKPPMCVVTAASQAQAFNSGSLASPDVFWDTIHVDTASGMGLMPGWPNWYVCTVPGFYDIDANLTWQSTGSASGTAQGWIVVARAAAQAITAGTGNPRTVTNYVCPIGESAFLSATSLASAANSPTTRLYLGLGDMVALAGEQNSGAAFNTGTLNGGSHMSILFRGYGKTDDSRQFNATINGGAVSDNLSTKLRFTKTYTCTASAAYNTLKAGGFININGFANQGTSFFGTPPLLTVQNNYISAYLLPFAQMQSDMGASATLLSIQLTMTNVSSQYATGAIAMIGYSTRGALTSNLVKTSQDHPNLVQDAFRRGQKKTFSLPVKTFSALATSAGLILLGNFSTTDGRYNGAWNGGPGWLSLTFTYLK